MIDFDLKDFNLEIDRLVNEMNEEPVELAKEVGLELVGEIIPLTPVDTGRARGSWTVSFDRPDGHPSKEQAESLGGKGQEVPATGTGAETNARAKIQTFEGGEIFITSNVEYMEYLEAGASPQSERFIELAVETVTKRLAKR